MCDTMIAVGSATKNGKIIFAKNSDRDANETQVFLHFPRQNYDLEKRHMLKTTYIEIPQVAETYEIMISKPVWMWGCEIGFNEFGVVIGNEAVFTTEEYGPESLIGMDLIRLALERKKTAKEALDYIIELIEVYGQGGNCSATKKFEYHNSFIIADKISAYLLETAGKFWAYKKIDDGVYAISNGLTLENDFDNCHEGLIQDAISKKLCEGRNDFNFRQMYSDPLIYENCGCVSRRKLALQMLNSEYGEITPDTMRRVLSAHIGEEGKFEQGSMLSVCVHEGGGDFSGQTTASLIAIPEDGEYWYTGSSLPCISLFKPYNIKDPFVPFSFENEMQARDYWRLREEISRMFLDKRLDLVNYHKELQQAQDEIDRIFSENPSLKGQEKCFDVCEDFASKMHKVGSKSSSKNIGGDLIFKENWKKINEEFKKEKA